MNYRLGSRDFCSRFPSDFDILLRREQIETWFQILQVGKACSGHRQCPDDEHDLRPHSPFVSHPDNLTDKAEKGCAKLHMSVLAHTAGERVGTVNGIYGFR